MLLKSEVAKKSGETLYFSVLTYYVDIYKRGLTDKLKKRTYYGHNYIFCRNFVHNHNLTFFIIYLRIIILSVL